MDDAIANLSAMLRSLRETYSQIEDIAQQHDAHALVFASKMLSESLNVYESELYRFIRSLPDD